MSTSSSDPSVASEKVNGHLKPPLEGQTRRRRAVANAVHSTTAQDVLLFLVAFRILNALTIRTFFQPDEYFQSLEPAWRIVFGKQSGAWITWEWRNALRSAIHPSIFATVYYVADQIAEVLRLNPATRAELFLAAPKILQAVFAALADYYTWQLAGRVYGRESYQPWASLALTVLSPWQWFCSTRTLSNCLETTLTIAALYNWPWQWSLTDRDHARYDSAGLRMREGAGEDTVDETTRLRRSLLFAALATILRPTNILIWISLTAMTCLKMTSGGWLARFPLTDKRILVEFTSPAFLRATNTEWTKLITESILCGSTVLALSVLVDRFYYQFWTFPPLKFLYFNVVQSLSVYYGRNDWHYYLSQGYPLLLTTALPFAMAGIYQSLFSRHPKESPLTATILSQLATIACAVSTALSLISHKEVRFIYPLLPLLHILAASPLTHFFASSLTHPLRSRLIPRHALLKRLLLTLLILINATIGIYTTTIHSRGVIDILTYLRHQHETHYLTPPNHHHHHHNPSNLTAAFLMPCHSTPWRSHLIHPGISAWALSCEPPINLSEADQSTYLDEADRFYADPLLWLRQNMSRPPPPQQQRAARGGIFTTTTARGKGLDAHGRRRLEPLQARGDKKRQQRRRRRRRREWPDYLVFFAQAEAVMEIALRGSGYGECWRGFNSHWTDDWRRAGDVVVWCLHPERKIPEEQEEEDGKGAAGQEQGNMWWGNTVDRIRDWVGGKEGKEEKKKRLSASAGKTAGGHHGHEKHVPTAATAIRDHGVNILGGARGPWGVGKSRPEKHEPISRWWGPLSRWWWWGEGKGPVRKRTGAWS